jgi:predicted small lipoprotein YifL
MCRYAEGFYRTHFVCVPCRAVRKEFPRAATETPVRCVRCSAPMVDAGRDLHAPRRADRDGWRKLALLLADGTRFSGCGCKGPGPMPPTFAMARAAIDARTRRERDEEPLRAAARARNERRYGRRPTFGQGRRPAAARAA